MAPAPHGDESVQRQIELVQAMVERAFAPIDAFFDLFEQSGSEMHRQADALSESARALEPAADLIRVQAELFERTVRTVGSPVRSPKALPASRAAISRQPVTGPCCHGWRMGGSAVPSNQTVTEQKEPYVDRLH